MKKLLLKITDFKLWLSLIRYGLTESIKATDFIFRKYWHNMLKYIYNVKSLSDKN